MREIDDCIISSCGFKRAAPGYGKKSTPLLTATPCPKLEFPEDNLGTPCSASPVVFLFLPQTQLTSVCYILYWNLICLLRNLIGNTVVF